jgi:hypothetical protein
MTRKRWWLVAGVAVLAVAAAVGLSIVLTGGGGGKQQASTAEPPAGPDWEQLYRESRVGAKETAVLALWPKIPYQHYSDNLKDDCYEWQGDNLYNLCFKGGVLKSKTTF